ncbi:MAG: HEAT repeat domain-containing protein [Myxococcales bacterium]|nr:HEAT repeat domain-containing protein [Myxococcales bacterium]
MNNSARSVERVNVKLSHIGITFAVWTDSKDIMDAWELALGLMIEGTTMRNEVCIPFSGWLIAILTSVMLFGATGCTREDTDSCEYWTKQLVNPSNARNALVQVGQMKCKDAIPKMKEMFDEGQYTENIIVALREIEDKDAAREILSKGLRIKDIGSKCANIIAEMQLSEARPALIEILSTNRNPSAREASLEALVQLTPDKTQIEDTLIAVLEDDPSLQGIKVNARASEELGKMKSVKAVDALVKSLFLKDSHNAEIYQYARLALVRIGEPAAAALSKAAMNQFEPMTQMAMAKNIPTWEWLEGPKLSQLLGDLRLPSGADAVAANMLRDLQKIEGLSEAQNEKWIQNQSNRLVIGMLSLGKIGSDSPTAALAAIIPNQNERDTSQRLRAASALGFIGTQTAVDALVNAYKEEKDYRFRAALLQPLAAAMDEAHIATWTEIEEYIKPKTKDGSLYYEQQVLYDQFKDEQTGPKTDAYISVVRECGTNSTCYLNKLTSKDLYTREKATIMAMRGIASAPETFKALLAAFKESAIEETDLRNFLVMALGRVGTAANAKEIEQFSESLKQKGKAEGYWASEMLILAEALSHKK